LPAHWDVSESADLVSNVKPATGRANKMADNPTKQCLAKFLSCIVLSLVSFGHVQAATISPEAALARMYNFDFPDALQILSQWNQAHPEDPLGHALGAATYLFSEFARLHILDGEFFEDDKRIVEKQGATPDPKIRASFYKEIDKAKQLAQARLKKDPNDQNALFAYTISLGLTGDYVSLVDKRGVASLTYSKEAQAYAVRLLKINPNYADAYITTGFSEYLVGSLPFFMRWFVHFDDTQGDKQLAIKRLQKVARDGHFLGPYARILLSIIYLREHEPAKSEALLAQLLQDFPENPLLRKEFGKVKLLTQSGQAQPVAERQ
jgi:hypothetical protein